MYTHVHANGVIFCMCACVLVSRWCPRMHTQSLKELRSKGTRTVYRLTLVKERNIEELQEYAKLVRASVSSLGSIGMICTRHCICNSSGADGNGIVVVMMVVFMIAAAAAAAASVDILRCAKCTVAVAELAVVKTRDSSRTKSSCSNAGSRGRSLSGNIRCCNSSSTCDASTSSSISTCTSTSNIESGTRTSPHCIFCR